MRHCLSTCTLLALLTACGAGGGNSGTGGTPPDTNAPARLSGTDLTGPTVTIAANGAIGYGRAPDLRVSFDGQENMTVRLGGRNYQLTAAPRGTGATGTYYTGPGMTMTVSTRFRDMAKTPDMIGIIGNSSPVTQSDSATQNRSLMLMTGRATPATDLPIDGTMLFEGRGRLGGFGAAQGRSIDVITAFSVDFSKRALTSGIFTNQRDFTLTLAPTLLNGNRFETSGTVTGADLDASRIDGQFFGPATDQAGGTLVLMGKDGKHYAGLWASRAR